MSVVLVILIIAFSAVTLFSMGAMLIMRHREQNRKDSADIAKTIAELDAALDASLEEINKMGALITKEIDEKYQEILFMYNLISDKQKENWTPSDSKPLDNNAVSDMIAQHIEMHSAKLRLIKDEAIAVSNISNNVPVFVHKRPTFSNPRHGQIWDMHEQGANVPDIARELGMGQGEVKLILELASRAS
jgi:hypothetical protein